MTKEIIMTKENRTDITFILDRSGSMSGSETDTIGGFNEFIKKQKEVKGKCRVTTVLFDNQYEFLNKGTKLKNVPELTDKQYFVRGSTALYDAMGKAIGEAKDRFSKLDKNKRPTHVLFVVITDGGENSSQEINLSQLQSLIKEQQDNDWDFVFLGADLDAFQAYGNLGLNAKNVGTVSKDRIFYAIQTLGLNTASYRGMSMKDKGKVELTAGVVDESGK